MTDAELIERLQKATGPDREIDLSIHLAIEPDGSIAKLMKYRRGFDGKEGYAWDIHHAGSVCFERYDDSGRCTYNGGYPLLRYTGSVDAALTLVPSTCNWTVDGFPTGLACASVYEPDADGASSGLCDGATPAIAIAISALKALASGEGGT